MPEKSKLHKIVKYIEKVSDPKDGESFIVMQFPKKDLDEESIEIAYISSLEEYYDVYRALNTLANNILEDIKQIQRQSFGQN